MALEKLNRESLNNALTPAGQPLQRQLSSEDGSRLTATLERTLRRWPSQENADTIAEFLADFEQLALKFSLQRVEQALNALRINREQKFFPKPDEVAEEIERQRQDQKLEAAMLDAIDYTERMEKARRDHFDYMESKGYVRVDGRWELAQ
jgi:hypothetical protein